MVIMLSINSKLKGGFLWEILRGRMPLKEALFMKAF